MISQDSDLARGASGVDSAGPRRAGRLRSASSRCWTSTNPDAFAHILDRLHELGRGVRPRLPQVGSQPRSGGSRGPRHRIRRRCTTRPSPCTGCSTSCGRRHPRLEIETLRGRWRPHRSRNPRANRPGLGLRLPTIRCSASAIQRWTALPPAAGADRLAPRCRTLTHHRPANRPLLPARSGPHFPRRHRMGSPGSR